jgi:hypothetical protein
MKKLLVIPGLLIAALILMSCYMTAEQGSGDVIKKDRKIDGDFNAIKVSQGIDLYLKQGDKVTCTVETDDNVYDLLMTEVKNETLHIYFDKNVKKVKTKKVWITAPNINALHASSGADIVGESVIKSDELKLKASSGADIEINVNADKLSCSSSSGADIVVEGECNNLKAHSSSGSDIDAKDLKANHVSADCSSGSDIMVQALESLKAEASSGGGIKFSGNPKNVDKHKSSGGSIKKM